MSVMQSLSTTKEQQTNPQVIPAMQVRQQFGEIMDRAVYQGKSVIVERSGKRLVAILPIQRYERLIEKEQAARERFFFMTETIQSRFAPLNLSEEESMALANTLVAEVRAEARAEREATTRKTA